MTTDLSDSNHPIWSLLRSTIRVVVVGACLFFVYSKVDSRDLITLLIVALGEGTITAGKSLLEKKE